MVRSRWGSMWAVALGLVWAGSALAEDVKTKEVTANNIKLMVPEDWKEQEPTSRLRLAQIEIPAAEGDDSPAELVVFHFGAAGGGGVDANISRWVNQFDADDRKVKIYEGTSKQGKYLLVELVGTWNKPVGPPIQMRTQKTPESRALQVILHSEKDGDYFLRLAGPDKTVAAQAEALRKSFGADLKAEKERKKEE